VKYLATCQLVGPKFLGPDHFTQVKVVRGDHFYRKFWSDGPKFLADQNSRDMPINAEAPPCLVSMVHELG